MKYIKTNVVDARCYKMIKKFEVDLNCGVRKK
jgi:hypothetical protein